MSSRTIDRTQLAWWVIGFALAGALIFVVYSFIGTIVFGLFFYYATRPLYQRINRQIGPPSLAAAIALLLLALPAFLLVLYTAAIAANELIKLTNQTLVQLVDSPITSQQLAQITDIERLIQIELTQLTPDQIRRVFSSLGSAGNFLSVIGVGLVHLFVMIALAFYLLRDDHQLSRWVRSRFGDERGVLETYLDAVDNDFTSIFFGNILNAVITGTIGVLAYSILNITAPAGVAIPAAALLGLVAGVASLIPVVGMKLVYVPVAVYLAVTSYFTNPETLWFTASFVAVSLIIVDTIPDLVLRPYVSGRRLHVGAVMVAYTFGPLLFGWYGVFLAPIILVLVVNFALYVLPTLISREQIRPYSVDPGVAVRQQQISMSDSVVVGDGHGRRKDSSAEKSSVKEDAAVSDVDESDESDGSS